MPDYETAFPDYASMPPSHTAEASQRMAGLADKRARDRQEMARDTEAGQRERHLHDRRWDWSQRTFPDASPLGPLRHLQEEIDEAIKAFTSGTRAEFKRELSDCRLLLDDALDRAGITPEEHLADREAKQAINERRKWHIGADGAGRHVKAEVCDARR